MSGTLDKEMDKARILVLQTLPIFLLIGFVPLFMQGVPPIIQFLSGMTVGVTMIAWFMAYFRIKGK